MNKPVTLAEGIGQLTAEQYQLVADQMRMLLHQKLSTLAENDPANLEFYEAMWGNVDTLLTLVTDSGKLVEMYAALTVATRRDHDRIQQEHARLLDAMREVDDSHPEVAALIETIFDSEGYAEVGS